MRHSLILRTVVGSWLAVFANAVVGFLLTPYILHNVGDEAYGLWVLIVGLTGYYGLLDIGVRSSVVRYVSHHAALHDKDSINRVVATSFYFYLGLCLLVIGATILLVPHLSSFFSLRAESASAFKILFLLAGVVQGLTLPLTVFVGSLEAMGRFDKVYGVRVGTLVLRLILVVLVLQAGGGLLGAGAVILFSNLLAYSILVPLAFREIDGLSLHPRWVHRDTLQKSLRYGLTSFSIGVGESFRNFLYPVVIARFLSASAVTFFALPLKLLSFPLAGIGTMTEFVNPLSSRLEARQDHDKLRSLLLLSVQGAFLLYAPLAVLLVLFGRELLTLWVGGAYASGYPVLVLLTFGLGASATQSSAQSMLFGIGRHRGLVWLRLGEGVSIALLGIALIKVWGIWGFALAVAVSLLVFNLVLIPRHLCSVVGLSLHTYFREGILKPCSLALPLAVVLMGMRSLFMIQNWATLIATFLVAGFVYLLTLALVGPWRARRSGRWLSLSVLEVFEQKFLRRSRRYEASSVATSVW